MRRRSRAAITEWNDYLPEYRNPQQEESGGQSRMLLVMVGAFALILVSQFLFFKNKPNAPTPEQTAQTAKAPAATGPAVAAARGCPSRAGR